MDGTPARACVCTIGWRSFVVALFSAVGVIERLERVWMDG